MKGLGAAMDEAATPRPNTRSSIALYFYAALLVVAGSGAVAMVVALLMRYRMIGNVIDGGLLIALGGMTAVTAGLLRRAHLLNFDNQRKAVDLQVNVQAILDTVPDAMIVTSEGGHILAFS
ncbi:MAG TPA: hypothetical protein VGI30_12525 [Caulobacteraceae bacterium]